MLRVRSLIATGLALAVPLASPAPSVAATQRPRLTTPNLTQGASGLISASGTLHARGHRWRVALERRAAHRWVRIAGASAPVTAGGAFTITWTPKQTAPAPRLRVIALHRGKARARSRSGYATRTTPGTGGQLPTTLDQATTTTPQPTATTPAPTPPAPSSPPAPPVRNPLDGPTTPIGGALGAYPTLRDGRLNPGQALMDSQGRYIAHMQHDGNFVIYRLNGPALWASNTAGHPGAALVQEGGGNFAVKLNDQTLWSTGTSWYPDTQLTLTSDGDLVVTAAGRTIWTRVRGYVGDVIGINEALRPGQRMRSADSTAFAFMRANGRLELFDGGYPVWQSWFTPTPGAMLILRSDGLAGLWDGQREVEAYSWSPNSHHLYLSNDGHLVLVENDGREWTLGIL